MATVALSHDVPREIYFERAAEAERLHGDIAGTAHLKQLGKAKPTVPPEIAASAVHRANRDYLPHYEELRLRVRQAILRPGHAVRDQWRVDRSEAALHLVAWELVQGRSASTALIKKYLYDAWWALDHTIATILFEAPGPEADIWVTPAMIQRGESAKLQWNTKNADRAWIDGLESALSGSRGVSPDATTDYRIVARGEGGEAVDQTQLRVVQPPPPAPKPPTASIVVSPARITDGECADLSWTSTNATSARINGNFEKSAGSRAVCPSTNTEYLLVVEGPGGRATDDADLIVIPRKIQRWRVLFDFDEWHIREDAVDTMAKVADYMRDNPALMMTVEGHTDWIGTEEYNKSLGTRRAESVRDYFVTIFGISPGRFVLVSKGEMEPIAPNAKPDGSDDPAGRQMNRRAAFIEIR